MTKILTHRGLDPSKNNYFAESSREAFEDQLERGYGLEFDVIEHNGDLVIAHDEDFERITRRGCHVISLKELLNLIRCQQRMDMLSALHLKNHAQTPATLERLASLFEVVDVSKFFIFDVTPDTAEYFRHKNPALMLAPSVAHPYDIVRYAKATGDTLFTFDEVAKRRDLFEWVLLDEWDRADKDGKIKKFYTKELFDTCRAAGFKIALIMPELHATSPGLLGGESHQDARTHESLHARWSDILSLEPDAVCTDYPDEVRALIRTTHPLDF